MKSTLSFSVALVLATAFGTTHAATGDVVNASGVMSNLSYQVRDLNPGDDIDATVTFGDPFGDVYGGGYAVLMRAYDYNLQGNANAVGQFVKGYLFTSDNGVLNQPGGNAIASKVGTTLSAQAHLTTQDVGRELGAPLPSSAGSNGFAAATFSRDVEIIENGGIGSSTGLAFTLAPHTAITFNTEFTGDTRIDLSSLIGSDAARQAQALHLNLNARSDSSVSLAIQYPWNTQPDEAVDGSPWAGLYLSSFQMLDELGQLHVGNHELASAQQALSVSFTNNTDVAQQRVLNYTLRMHTNVSIGKLPEPGTWLLMGLGLLGVFARARVSPARQAAPLTI